MTMLLILVMAQMGKAALGMDPVPGMTAVPVMTTTIPVVSAVPVLTAAPARTVVIVPGLRHSALSSKRKRHN